MSLFYHEQEFINSIISIVKQTSIIILDVYNNYDMKKIIEYKKDNSPLTIADKRASDYICEELDKLTPDIPIICEETDDMDYCKRKEYDYIWLVDPLDGTKEFIKKNGEFTVNIGLSYLGKAVFGIVGIPCKNKIYVGVVGVHGYVLDEDINTTMRTTNTNEFTIMTSRSHMNQQTKDFVNKYKSPKLISMGSSIKMLLVADGTADIYPRIAPTMEWDTCAAHAIVKSCGGQIYVYENNEMTKEMKYNKKKLLNSHFVCVNVDERYTIYLKDKKN
jgi:3'(2'), 5'-bisphosphate nucleotidase